MAMNCPFLFVYGTLMRGQQNELLRHCEAALVGRGTIQAKLYDLGEYPGAKTDHRQQVKGELYHLPNQPKTLALLDDYEGFVSLRRLSSLFVRERAEVSLEDGSTETAWVYFYNQPVDESRLIPDGDYRSGVRGKKADIA